MEKKLQAPGTSYELKPIETAEISRTADANWFESCSMSKLDQIEEYADKYWTGNLTKNPQIEILLIGKFTCELIES